MACTKYEFKVPSRNIKIAQEAFKHPIDKYLHSYEEICESSMEIGICGNRKIAEHYVYKVNPYRYFQACYPVIPEHATGCREIFRRGQIFFSHVFPADDLMETFTEDMTKAACDAYVQLEAKCRESFPKFPSIKQLKEALISNDDEVISVVVTFVHYANEMAKILLQQGIYSHDHVVQARQSISNRCYLFMMAAGTFKSTRKREEMDILWHRSFDAALIAFACVGQIFAGYWANEFKSSLVRIELLGSNASTLFNDLYTLDRDHVEQRDANFLDIQIKKARDNHKAAHEKHVRVLNACFKRFCRRINELKANNSDLRQLHLLLDYIEQLVIGSMVAANWVVPRYEASRRILKVVEIEDSEVAAWLASEYEDEEKYIDDLEETMDQRLNDEILNLMIGGTMMKSNSMFF